MSDLKVQALDAFLCHLPPLMEERPDQFVASHGKPQVGFSLTQHVAYQGSMARGYDGEEIVVFCIEPWVTEWFMPNACFD